MKIICAKNNLLSGVMTVSKAISGAKTTLSISECIMINARGNNIILTANDSDFGIETVIDGTIEESGKLAIDAKMFSEIIRKLPDEDVILETKENYVLSIKCGKSLFNIPGRDGEDFVYLPNVDKNYGITMSYFTLKELIRTTTFSSADKDNNQIMRGELLEVSEDNLKAVALDGHRIAIKNIKLKNSYENKKIIVPAKILNEVSKIVPSETDKEINVYFSNNYILFEFEDTKIVSRVIEGEFFKIDSMLYNSYETKASVNKKELYDCIDRATLLIKEGDKRPVVMDFNNEILNFRINSLLGNMSENIDITKTGKDIIIGINPKFMIDVLKVIDDENADIYMSNSKSPLIIKDENETYIYIILPINISNAV